MIRRLMPAAVALVLGLATASIANAAQLVMIDLRSCSYCAKFKREVAPTYASTPAGKIAPLRSVSPLKKWPEDLKAVRPAPYTPVFILVDEGREVGRFLGYQGAEHFWAQLNPLLARL